MKIRTINYIFLTIILLYSFAFIRFQEIDLGSTNLLLDHNSYCKDFNRVVVSLIAYLATALVIIYGVLSSIGYFCAKKNQTNFLSTNYQKYKQSFVFLFFNTVIVAGLLVELIKNIFDRPRPHTINNFGGENIYIGLWQTANTCVTNCSFPSGDAAAGFLVFPIVFVLTKNLKLSFVLGTVAGLIISYCRITLSKHFLSDVLFSFILVNYFVLISHALIYNRNKSSTHK
jgi:lipid A 4'-phosphatase